MLRKVPSTEPSLETARSPTEECQLFDLWLVSSQYSSSLILTSWPSLPSSVVEVNINIHRKEAKKVEFFLFNLNPLNIIPPWIISNFRTLYIFIKSYIFRYRKLFFLFSNFEILGIFPCSYSKNVQRYVRNYRWFIINFRII